MVVTFVFAAAETRVIVFYQIYMVMIYFVGGVGRKCRGTVQIYLTVDADDEIGFPVYKTKIMGNCYYSHFLPQMFLLAK